MSTVPVENRHTLRSEFLILLRLKDLVNKLEVNTIINGPFAHSSYLLRVLVAIRDAQSSIYDGLMCFYIFNERHRENIEIFTNSNRKFLTLCDEYNRLVGDLFQRSPVDAHTNKDLYYIAPSELLWMCDRKKSFLASNTSS